MEKLLNFLDQIKNEKEYAFFNRINKFENQNSADSWNGNVLKIDEIRDIFLYISEDNKTIKVSIGKFDPRIPFSYLVYLCHVKYIAKYLNGGLEFIGFYNSDYLKVNEIPFESIKIIGCKGGFSFDDIKNPDFTFELIHRKGRENSSFRGNPYYTQTCGGVIDGIWELAKFYDKWYEELENFENEWTQRLTRTPKSLM